MTSHKINYEGLEIECFGDYSEPEESVGYAGGWASELIKVNDVDIYWMLKPDVVQLINAMVVEENY
jgi:hypothetical protein